jgi:hypothetical protein
VIVLNQGLISKKLKRLTLKTIHVFHRYQDAQHNMLGHKINIKDINLNLITFKFNHLWIIRSINKGGMKLLIFHPISIKKKVKIVFKINIKSHLVPNRNL